MVCNLGHVSQSEGPLWPVGDLTKIKCNKVEKVSCIEAHLEETSGISWISKSYMTFIFCFAQFTLKPSITDDFSIRVGIKFYNHVVCTVCFDNGLI